MGIRYRIYGLGYRGIGAMCGELRGRMLHVGFSGGGPKLASRCCCLYPGERVSHTLSEPRAAASHTAFEVLLRLSAHSAHQHGVQTAFACAIQGRLPRARYTPGEAAALTRLSAARCGALGWKASAR
jgi:hypothetical protein